MPTPKTSSGAGERAGSFRRLTAGGETYFAFLPRPLPPDPPIRVDARLQELLDTANQALGRLDGISLLLPNPDQFLYTYVRKEAVLSSQIEGTQASLSDLLLYEHDVAPGVPVGDAGETANYILAMEHGLQRIAGGFPLSVRLFREIHAILLHGVRGRGRSPGEFRRSQNWIGGTRPGNARFVPPPAHEVEPAMAALEKFLHDDPGPTPILIKAALAHAQFETIHPFLDGNGRIGRLLITLLLCAEERVLSKPLLYLSLYLKRNRDDYYERLQRTRTHGEWEEWLEFFLEGVVDVAASATSTTRRILDLVQRDRDRIHTLGRAAASASRVYELAAKEIVVTIPQTARRLELSVPTVGKAVSHLEGLGILREMTGRARWKVYVYHEQLAVLNEGTEQPA
jgi:Fic family protein